MLFYLWFTLLVLNPILISSYSIVKHMNKECDRSVSLGSNVLDLYIDSAKFRTDRQCYFKIYVHEGYRNRVTMKFVSFYSRQQEATKTWRSIFKCLPALQFDMKNYCLSDGSIKQGSSIVKNPYISRYTITVFTTGVGHLKVHLRFSQSQLPRPTRRPTTTTTTTEPPPIDLGTFEIIGIVVGSLSSLCCLCGCCYKCCCSDDDAPPAIVNAQAADTTEMIAATTSYVYPAPSAPYIDGRPIPSNTSAYQPVPTLPPGHVPYPPIHEPYPPIHEPYPPIHEPSYPPIDHFSEPAPAYNTLEHIDKAPLTDDGVEIAPPSYASVIEKMGGKPPP